jgi:DNA-binding protein H-NS
VRHEDAARIVKQTTIPTLASIYRVETVIPKLPGASQEVVEQIREEIDGVLKGSVEELRAELSQFREVIDQNGLGDVPPLHYNREPYKFEVEISSPMGSRYLQIIEALDEAIGCVELLWLMEIFDWYQHIDGPRRMTKSVYSASNKIRQVQKTVENGLREHASEREEEKKRRAQERAQIAETEARRNGGASATKRKKTTTKKAASKKNTKPNEQLEEAPAAEPERFTMDDVMAASTEEDEKAAPKAGSDDAA